MPLAQWAWLRFQPWGLDALRKAARRHRDTLVEIRAVAMDEAQYAISIFGARGAVQMRALIDRIQFSNKKWVSVVPADDLAGFQIVATPEPPDHFDLLLGKEVDEEGLTRLADVFESHKRRNQG